MPNSDHVVYFLLMGDHPWVGDHSWQLSSGLSFVNYVKVPNSESVVYLLLGSDDP